MDHLSYVALTEPSNLMRFAEGTETADVCP